MRAGAAVPNQEVGPARSPAPPRRTQTVFAVDFGLKRIGLAVGQTVTRTASPLASIAAKDGKPDWGALDAALVQWCPNRLLVGLPIHMDGTESQMSLRARQFAKRLAERYGRRVDLIDERLTSLEAKSLAPKDDGHAVAASLIAETWLNGGQAPGA